MTELRKPREHTCLTLFVPGRYRSLEELPRFDDLPFKVDVEWEDNPRDGSFGKAYSFGTCTAEEVRAIDGAGGAVVLQLPVELHTYRAEIASLAERLRSAGALGIRIEQSKLGFTADAWVKRVSREGSIALYRVAAIMLGGQGTTRTLGLHVFSLPDVEIEATGSEAGPWLDAMSLYMLDEDPVFSSGNTFAPDAETPRRMIEWWPDTNYPEDSPCHNPFGLLRLGQPVERGRPQSKLRMMFIPALSALLRAAGHKKGAPLTAQEIESLRDNGACMAMDWRDARELERSRGYADIDPERAVECWTRLERLSS